MFNSFLLPIEGARAVTLCISRGEWEGTMRISNIYFVSNYFAFHILLTSVLYNTICYIYAIHTLFASILQIYTTLK
jgi:hypothetical protein